LFSVQLTVSLNVAQATCALFWACFASFPQVVVVSLLKTAAHRVDHVPSPRTFISPSPFTSNIQPRILASSQYHSPDGGLKPFPLVIVPPPIPRCALMPTGDSNLSDSALNQTSIRYSIATFLQKPVRVPFLSSLLQGASPRPATFRASPTPREPTF